MVDTDEIFEGLQLPPLKAAGAPPRKTRNEQPWPPTLDRSGSMGSESMAIARFYFLLSLLHLHAKYGRQ